MKNKRFSRIISLILSAVMMCTAALAGTGAAFAAGDTYEINKTNLIDDPGFDLPGGFVEKNEYGRWTGWKVSKSSTEGRGGSSGVQFSATDSSIEQIIDGSNLQAGTTYIFSAWVKVVSGDTLQVGVKEFGGSSPVITSTSVGDGDWKQYSVKFTYISGDPIVYVYNNAWIGGTLAVAYVDDASLLVEGDVEYAKITNGEITVRGDALDMKGFSAVYTSSLNPGNSQELNLTPDGSTNTLKFDPIAEAPLPQTITVILSYKDEIINLSFTIAANDGLLVPVEIASLRVTNGSVVITLKEAPTLAPAVSDFQFDLTVDGDKAPFSIGSFIYDNNKTVTVGFDPVSSSPSADREVSLIVSANGTRASGTFTVTKGTSHTYYVSSSGSDSNDGLSSNQPFQTIDKLNSLTFVPGDRILFKSGDTFVGMFKPSGSGAEGAPIVVSSYGDGDRPVIQPDPDKVSEFGIGSSVANICKVNGAIWLENVDHWEIRGLELHDPSYNPKFYETGNLEVFNAGIRVVNVDQGDLSHFVFDDLFIHGFRGPGSNLGKASGGIQFNVNTVEDVPSCFVDVSITNCEIYQCGRSGIHSLSVWGYRYYKDDGSAWTNFYPGSYQTTRSYYPSRNLYIANNNIHEIDGDGVIVDSWFNAVLENNTVYRCAIHLSNPFQAAVGMFNWNSDNVVFQYNECYSNGVNATRHQVEGGTVEQNVTVQDGQGIEVDALNQNTWVQYNYLHDNAAFMMLCTEEPNIISINTYIRYNVSKNDGCNLTNTDGGMGWFLNGQYGYNTEVYNNTFVLGQSALKDGQLYLLKYNNSDQFKFYNNIFLYTGNTLVGVTGWQDNTDWQSNIFINIDGLPAQDNARYPNIPLTEEASEDLFAGGSGADAYRLTTDAYDGKGAYLPSMDDGMLNGVDFAGNYVEAPGIGAFQYAG